MVVVFGLLIAFVLVLVFSQPGTRACRWRADHSRTQDGLVAYRCAACGAEEWCEKGAAPRRCAQRRK